jgi:hypothetical protein
MKDDKDMRDLAEKEKLTRRIENFKKEGFWTSKDAKHVSALFRENNLSDVFHFLVEKEYNISIYNTKIKPFERKIEYYNNILGPYGTSKDHRVGFPEKENFAIEQLLMLKGNNSITKEQEIKLESLHKKGKEPGEARREYYNLVDQLFLTFTEKFKSELMPSKTFRRPAEDKKQKQESKRNGKLANEKPSEKPGQTKPTSS